MTGPRTITLRGNEAVKKPEIKAWVARGQGPQVRQTMQRMGWQLARGPAATVVHSCGPRRDKCDPNPGISMVVEGEAGGGECEGVGAVGQRRARNNIQEP